MVFGGGTVERWHDLLVPSLRFSAGSLLQIVRPSPVVRAKSAFVAALPLSFSCSEVCFRRYGSVARLKVLLLERRVVAPCNADPRRNPSRDGTLTSPDLTHAITAFVILPSMAAGILVAGLRAS